jgi:flagellar assembly factor FliW
MKIKRDILSSGWAGGHGDTPYPQRVASMLNESMVFNFPDGIPAFENSRRFVIILNPNIKPFIYLKSLDVEDLGFVCVDPFLVCSTYSIKIPAKDLSLLSLKEPSSAFVLSMVTVEKDPKNTTCNLLAPVIINMDNSVGRQVILDESFPVRYKIWEGLETFEKAHKG